MNQFLLPSKVLSMLQERGIEVKPEELTKIVIQLEKEKNGSLTEEDFNELICENLEKLYDKKEAPYQG